ncbi:MAG: hypothetical protein E7396_01765 [Ruminococcaceae bacterium]|nr:hypothetical protein [Oscillospiraceae bacterium]
MNIKISDITLREVAQRETNMLSFKEKIEVAKQLDKLNVDVIETAPITNGKSDVLFLHTISPIVKNSIISCPVELTEEGVEAAYEAIKGANKPRLHIIVPVSTVQMEYICHKKPDKVIEMIETLTKKAASLTEDVEVSMADSTRAERDFLIKAIKTAIASGAKTVTVCDSAGTMLPTEFAEYINGLYNDVEELKGVALSVECSNDLHMAAACAISCIRAGVTQIKTTMASERCPKLKSIADVFRQKTDSLGISTQINMTVLDNAVRNMSFVSGDKIAENTSFDYGTGGIIVEDAVFSKDTDIRTIAETIAKIGYDLSDEDVNNVYNEFVKTANKKNVGIKELDAIIASVAMQVSPTYVLKSYVINSGDIITPTANIELIKDEKVIHGISAGNGPIDASFMAIEQITGHHFELDDFQIQSVTRGHEAMGESVVKLRHEGKVYSGKGISTDVVGASIKAYISALNKICFEEEF